MESLHEGGSTGTIPIISSRSIVRPEYALATELSMFGDAVADDERSADWASRALELSRRWASGHSRGPDATVNY